MITYISKIWRGERSLARAFWIDYLLMLITIITCTAMLKVSLEAYLRMANNPAFAGKISTILIVYQYIFYLIIPGIFLYCYQFIAAVGLFRSSYRYKGFMLWKILGFISVPTVLLILIIQILFLLYTLALSIMQIAAQAS